MYLRFIKKKIWPGLFAFFLYQSKKYGKEIYDNKNLRSISGLLGTGSIRQKIMDSRGFGRRKKTRNNDNKEGLL